MSEQKPVKERAMEFYNKLILQEKIIVISAIVAVVSLFLRWYSYGPSYASGLGTSAYIYLVFFVYPVLTIFKLKPDFKILGGCGLISVITMISYIVRSSVALTDKKVYTASIGAYLFLLCCVGLCVAAFFAYKNQQSNS